MSSVLRPRGPLPARVYWTRRLLLLAVAVTVLVLVGAWLAPGGRGSQSDAGHGDAPASDGTEPTAAPAEPTISAAPGQGDADRSYGGKPERKDGAAGDRDAAGDRTDRDAEPGDAVQPPEAPVTTAPPARPSGPCEPSAVELTIEVDDSRAGEPNPATLLFRSVDVPACTLGLTPDTLAVQVTSGTDLIWSSTDCPARLPARQLVVRTDPPAVYEFTWSGHRSTPGCVGRGDQALPGGYRVEASLIGGEPANAYFDVR